MKMFVIADNVDTLTGMNLAGVNGVVVHEKFEFQDIFNEVIADKTIGIVLIMESFTKKFPDVVGNHKAKNKLPIIIEIPDRHGTGRSPDFITSYIDHAIGLKL